MCQNIAACLKLNRPWLLVVYSHTHSGHTQHGSGGVSSVENSVDHCCPLSIVIFVQGIFGTGVGSLKTLLHVYNSIGHSWPLSIVIFIQGIFSTGVGVCQNISAYLNSIDHGWSLSIVIIIQGLFSTGVGCFKTFLHV